MLATAQIGAACVLPDMRTDVRPGDPELPTEVTTSIAVTDFLDVDDEGQQLDIDMFVTLNWVDERLAGSVGCRFPITDVWFPRIRIMNSSNLRPAMRNAQNQIAVQDGGAVEYVQRLTGFVSRVAHH